MTDSLRGSSPEAPTRRQQILDAAIGLFQQRGFHGAGVDDIGAAAGITGPAVYRHFASKDELLVAVLDLVVDRLLRDVRRIVAEAGSGREALGEIVRFHIAFSLEDHRLIGVYLQEERSLPDPDRRRIRKKQALYVDEWTGVLRSVRPELSEAEARTAVQAAIGLIHSVAFFESDLPAAELAALLEEMALHALAG